MTITHTARLQLPVVQLDEAADIDVALQPIVNILDAAVMFRQGVASSRPAFGTVPPGTIFIATDTQLMSISVNPGNPTAQVSTAWIDVPGQGVITPAMQSSSVQQSTFQTGDLMDTAVPAGASDPTGWLYCDGRAVSRTDPLYAALFAKLGTVHGAGDGTTTFNIPDHRNRAAIGNDTFGTAAGAGGRLPNSNHALGQYDGQEQITLLSSQCGVPAHTHSNPSHAHTASTDSQLTGGFVPNVPAGSTVSSNLPGNISEGFVPVSPASGWFMIALGHGHNVTVNSTTPPATNANSTANAASPTKLTQPYAIVNKKIKL